MYSPGLTFIFEDDPFLLEELTTFNNFKLWFGHLEVPLTNTLQESYWSDGLSELLNRLSRKTYLLVHWCVPDKKKHKNENVNLVRDWIPCGHVLIVQGGTQYYARIHHQVNRMFHIQFHFQLFEMDFARINCADSSELAICRRKQYADGRGWMCPRGWRFCGYRQPWLLTVPHSVAFVRLEQVNALHPCNITYVYTSIEKHISEIYIKHGTKAMISWTPPHPSNLINNLRFIDTALKWVIKVPIGYVQHFIQLDSHNDDGILEIYEGEERYHRILQWQFYYKDFQQLDVVSRYFLCNVQYHRSSLYVNRNETAVFSLKYFGKPVKVEYLSVDKTTTFNNKGDISSAIYVIKMADGGFPNVSVTTRTFQGWHQDHCYYGGYLLHHSIRADNLHFDYSQGPLCSTSLPSQPFIGSHGPKSIIFGSYRYYLIVYAFGPLYHIDIDIVMQISKCEGLFEPINLCTVPITQKDHTFHHELQARRILQGAHFTLVCSARIQSDNHTAITHSAEFFNIKKCIIFQSIALPQGYSELYTFKGKMDIEITVVNGPSFWSGAPITASHTSHLTVGSLNLQTELYSDSRSLHISKQDVAILVFHSKNIREHLRYNTRMKLNTIKRKPRSCIITEDHEQSNDTDLKVLQITNFCGLLHCGTQVLIHVFKFTLHLKYQNEQRFMYLKLKSACKEPTLNFIYRILTVITTKRSVSHSIDVISKEFHFCHYYMPLSFIYDNHAQCSFILEYRLRYFRVSTIIDMIPNTHWSGIQVSYQHGNASKPRISKVHNFQETPKKGLKQTGN